MAVLEILKFPHPVLKKRSEAVSRIDGEVRKLIHDMRETMVEAGGIGLAACQVGVSRRVIVLDVSPMDPQHSFFALIDPEIISGEGEIDHEEGCLSVPDCLEKEKRKEGKPCAPPPGGLFSLGHPPLPFRPCRACLRDPIKWSVSSLSQTGKKEEGEKLFFLP